jgi:hypothetical protein
VTCNLLVLVKMKGSRASLFSSVVNRSRLVHSGPHRYPYLAEIVPSFLAGIPVTALAQLDDLGLELGSERPTRTGLLLIHGLHFGRAFGGRALMANICLTGGGPGGFYADADTAASGAGMDFLRAVKARPCSRPNLRAGSCGKITRRLPDRRRTPCSTDSAPFDRPRLRAINQAGPGHCG